MMTGAHGGRTVVIAHHHPGRLRLRSDVFTTDVSSRRAVTDWLKEQSGVSGVEAQAHTGSVLIRYNPSEVSGADLLERVAQIARLMIAEPGPCALEAETVFRAARGLDDSVRQLSDGRFSLGLVIPLALGAGSFGSFVFSAHSRVPRWDNLLYWSVQFFMLFNAGADPAHRAQARSA